MEKTIRYKGLNLRNDILLFGWRGENIVVPGKTNVCFGSP